MYYEAFFIEGDYAEKVEVCRQGGKENGQPIKFRSWKSALMTVRKEILRQDRKSGWKVRRNRGLCGRVYEVTEGEYWGASHKKIGDLFYENDKIYYRPVGKRTKMEITSKGVYETVYAKNPTNLGGIPTKALKV